MLNHHGLREFVQVKFRQTAFGSCHHFIAVKNVGNKLHFSVATFHLGFDIYACKLIIYLRCGDVGAPNGDVSFVSHNQMHISVETGAGIPARLLLKVLKANRQSVVCAVRIYIRSDVEVEGVVAIRPYPHLFSINIYMRVAHCAIKLNLHLLAFIKSRHVKVESVPACTRKRKSAGSAIVLNGCSLSVLHNGHAMNIVRLVKRPIDSPVVGHGHRLPLRVVEVHLM